MTQSTSSIVRGVVTVFISIGVLMSCAAQPARKESAENAKTKAQAPATKEETISVAEPTFATWLRAYIPKAYPGVTVEDHGEWFRAVLNDKFSVAWACITETVEPELKDISGVVDKTTGKFREGRIVFVSDPTKAAMPGIVRFEGVGYYIPSFSSSTMGHFRVLGHTVVQFTGDAKKFVEDMSKAYLKEPKHAGSL
jgi:hypothetical protein